MSKTATGAAVSGYRLTPAHALPNNRKLPQKAEKKSDKAFTAKMSSEGQLAMKQARQVPKQPRNYPKSPVGGRITAIPEARADAPALRIQPRPVSKGSARVGKTSPGAGAGGGKVKAGPGRTGSASGKTNGASGKTGNGKSSPQNGIIPKASPSTDTSVPGDSHPLPRKTPSYKDLYELHDSMRMHRDITDLNYDEKNLPRQALGGGKLENAMEIVEIVNADAPPPAEDDQEDIEELARINSMEKVAIWIQATDPDEADKEPPIDFDLDPIPEVLDSVLVADKPTKDNAPKTNGKATAKGVKIQVGGVEFRSRKGVS